MTGEGVALHGMLESMTDYLDLPMVEKIQGPPVRFDVPHFRCLFLNVGMELQNGSPDDLRLGD